MLHKVTIPCNGVTLLQDGHIDRGDTQRAIEVYKDIHSSTEEVRKDKEMEIDLLSADINNWEGEVR